HLHAVEEILRVFEGQADVWIGEAHVTLTPGQLVVVPAGRKHGFANNGTTVLRIQSTLAEPVFEAAYDDNRATPRRWLPGELRPCANKQCISQECISGVTQFWKSDGRRAQRRPVMVLRSSRHNCAVYSAALQFHEGKRQFHNWGASMRSCKSMKLAL